MTPWQTLELQILDQIALGHNAFLDQVMPAVSFLGNSGWIWIVIAVLMVLSKRYRRGGWLLTTALVFCLLVGNLTLKPLIARIRPFDVNTLVTLLIAPPTDYSFPSGHSMASFAAATTLWHTDRRFGLAAFVLAALIAFSRLYLYVHYPTDVLGGTIIGLMLGNLAIYLFTRLDKRRTQA